MRLSGLSVVVDGITLTLTLTLCCMLLYSKQSVVVDGLSIVNIIRKKRDSEELADDEIEWFVTAATDRLITEAQIGKLIYMTSVFKRRIFSTIECV